MMSDPMANLGGPQPSQGSADAPNTSKEAVVDPLIMTVNLQRLERIRSVMGITSGVVAGICGITGLLPGLLCFATLHLITCLGIWLFQMNRDLYGTTRQSWFVYLTGSLQPTALSFTLFWTLFYGLVYLY